MKTTLLDLLHSINVCGADVDVYVDGFEAWAVCPPVELTEYGREYYAKALNATTDGYMVCDKDKSVNEFALHFLKDLAGYCGCTHYDKCFEGEDAKPV